MFEIKMVGSRDFPRLKKVPVTLRIGVTSVVSLSSHKPRVKCVFYCLKKSGGTTTHNHMRQALHWKEKRRKTGVRIFSLSKCSNVIAQPHHRLKLDAIHIFRLFIHYKRQVYLLINFAFYITKQIVRIFTCLFVIF